MASFDDINAAREAACSRRDFIKSFRDQQKMLMSLPAEDLGNLLEKAQSADLHHRKATPEGDRR